MLKLGLTANAIGMMLNRVWNVFQLHNFLPIQSGMQLAFIDDLWIVSASLNCGLCRVLAH